MAHPNLSGNEVGAEGAGRLTRVRGERRARVHLDLSRNGIGNGEPDWAGWLVGGCTVLFCLDLGLDKRGAEGGRRLVRLADCACPCSSHALAHLKLISTCEGATSMLRGRGCWLRGLESARR